jgi:hypothetical protein
MEGDPWQDTSSTPATPRQVTAITRDGSNNCTAVVTAAMFATGSGTVAGDASMLVNIPADELVGTVDIANLPNDPTFSVSVTTPLVTTGQLVLPVGPCPTTGTAGTFTVCANESDLQLKVAIGASPPVALVTASGTASQRVTPLTFIADGTTSGWSGTLSTGSVGSTGTGEELLDSTRYRTQFDLRGYSEARLVVRTQSVAGNAGSVLCAEYSTNGGTSWSGLNGSTGSSGICSPITATNTSYPIGGGGWVAITNAAKNSDVILSIFAFGGDGSTTPFLGRIDLQLR